MNTKYAWFPGKEKEMHDHFFIQILLCSYYIEDVNHARELMNVKRGMILLVLHPTNIFLYLTSRVGALLLC